MNLEDLKKGATTSELGLICFVEQLVRFEYDLDVIKKAVHKELIDEIQKRITGVLTKEGVIGGDINAMKYMHSGDRQYIKEVLHKIGDAIRLDQP